MRPASRTKRTSSEIFCSVPAEYVISAVDVETIYEVPLWFHQQRLDLLVLDFLKLETRPADLAQWQRMVDKAKKTYMKYTMENAQIMSVHTNGVGNGEGSIPTEDIGIGYHKVTYCYTETGANKAGGNVEASWSRSENA